VSPTTAKTRRDAVPPLFPTVLVMGPVSVVHPEDEPPLELVLDPLPLLLDPPLLDDPPELELVLPPDEPLPPLLLPPSPWLSNEGLPLLFPQARYVAPTATMDAIARRLRMRQITVIRP
jgi:hypothetical protein